MLGQSLLRFKRLFSSISFRIQSVALCLSLIGIFFTIKGYLEIDAAYGAEASKILWDDLLLQLLVVLVVNAIAATINLYNVVKPIRTMTEVMRSLTQNKLDVEIPYLEQPSEVGSLARKAEQFKIGLIAKRNLEDGKIEAETRAREEKVMLGHVFESFVQNVTKDLVNAIADLQTNFMQMSKVISTTNNRAGEVVLTTQAALENVESVAHSADTMTQSVQEIENTIKNSSSSVRMVVESQEKAGEISNALASATSQIDKIIEVIQEVAGQINLLALNATIEAARAGEAGKGFSVVAGEVKMLAGQTAKATEQISDQIHHIKQVSSEVIHALSTISDAVKDMENNSSAISQAISEQTEVTRQIASNMNNAALHTARISKDITNVRHDSVEAMEASEKVLQIVNTLSRLSGNLNTEISAFIKEINAA